MGTYAHNENCLTPVMTSNTAPSPNVSSASTEAQASQAAWKAFDQTVATEWSAGYGNDAPWWIKFDFGDGNTEEAESYTVSASENSDFYNYAPKTWTLQGSNNDVDWDVLDTQTDVSSWTTGEMREYAISSHAAYRYYKLNITVGYGTYAVVGEIELVGGAATSIIDLSTEVKASEEAFSDLLSSVIAGLESLSGLNSEITASGTSLIDLKSDIAADFLTDFSNLKTEVHVKAQQIIDLVTDVRAGNQTLIDLNVDTEAKAQVLSDLLTDIRAQYATFKNLNTEITAVRSKWWLKTEIKAGCAARWNFNTEWNPDRFLKTAIEAKKSYDFSFKTQASESYAATTPAVELKIPGYSFPLRTLFLDYVSVGGSNEYPLQLWWARGLTGKGTLKNAKTEAEYINTENAGGYEVVTLDWISCKVGSGEYQTVNETELLLGDVLCDSYMEITLKIDCPACALTRGLVFFKLSITGDYKESIFGDSLVYRDGSQYHAGEQDDYKSIDFICRLYAVE